MGTPDFARTILERLVADGHDVCGVFTQPDKPRNRNKVTPSPVKEYALSQNIPVFQPVTMRDGTALEDFKTLAPELAVVAAYGRILPEEMLAVPVHGCINAHASILPKYRGAAPINRAILDGEKETGVTVMHMAKECDAGDMILVKKQAIRPPSKKQNASYAPQVGSFGKLKGRLTRPVKGTVVGRFGTERQDQPGTTWQGMQFRAQEGSEVSACAAGKVVFSDWLRGFGNLIIIDHGNTYMSIYGNNESIFTNVGDTVKQGETISSVGISGGLGEPGLYFELRYKGKPINPQPWLKP